MVKKNHFQRSVLFLVSIVATLIFLLSGCVTTRPIHEVNDQTYIKFLGVDDLKGRQFVFVPTKRLYSKIVFKKDLMGTYNFIKFENPTKMTVVRCLATGSHPSFYNGYYEMRLESGMLVYVRTKDVIGNIYTDHDFLKSGVNENNYQDVEYDLERLMDDIFFAQHPNEIRAAINQMRLMKIKKQVKPVRTGKFATGKQLQDVKANDRYAKNIALIGDSFYYYPNVPNSVFSIVFLPEPNKKITYNRNNRIYPTVPVRFTITNFIDKKYDNFYEIQFDDGPMAYIEIFKFNSHLFDRYDSFEKGITKKNYKHVKLDYEFAFKKYRQDIISKYSKETILAKIKFYEDQARKRAEVEDAKRKAEAARKKAAKLKEYATVPSKKSTPKIYKEKSQNSDVNSLPGISDHGLKAACGQGCGAIFSYGSDDYNDCVYCCTHDCD